MSTSRAARATLKISDDLALPLDAITNTMVIYGGKGMGKTNLLSVIAEEVARSGQRFSIIDPMGVCWGLRHSKDGKGKGIEILILGGRHGDIQIEPTSGAVVADLVIDEDVSVVVDISRRADGRSWGKNEKIRFVRDYATRLFERAGERRRPLLQIIDEVARFCPQMIRSSEVHTAECLGAISQLVEEGRNNGVGVLLVTQRSARLNKDVAELADCMIAFRTVGPNSVNAILDWFGDHIPKDRWNGLVEQLRKLPRGTALVVSPGWLDFEGAVAMRARETFDSSATPKSGGEAHARGKGAMPDLARYQDRMRETEEKAKADDPRELRRQIAELNKKLAAKPAAVETAAAPAPAKPKVKVIRIPILKEGHVERLERALSLATSALHAATSQETFLEELAKAAAKPPVSVPTPAAIARAFAPPPRKTAAAVADPDPAGHTRPQQRILDALAWVETIGLKKASRPILGFLAEASPSSSAFLNNLGVLRTKGLIDYPGQGEVALTDAGRAAAAIPEQPVTPEQLHQMIYAKVTRPQAEIIKQLVRIYPQSVDRPSLAEDAGASCTSSAFLNNLGSLRSLGLIDYPQQGQVVARPLLFLES